MRMNTAAKRLGKALAYALPVLLPLAAALIVQYNLAQYQAHEEPYGFVMFLIAWFGGIYLIAMCVRFIRRRRWGMSALQLASILALVAVFALYMKIPLCPECDHTTAEDLGFLIKWIPLGP